MAYGYCQCKEQSKDIVQEMYLKIGLKKKNKINHCYVKTVIKSIFINYQVKQKTYFENGERIKIITYNIEDYKNKF